MRNVLSMEELCLPDAVSAAYSVRCRVALRDSLARHCIIRRPASCILNANGWDNDINSKLSDNLY
jgi:hypothetical protein